MFNITLIVNRKMIGLMLIKEHKNVSMKNDILLESIKSLFIRMDNLYQ